MSRKALTTVRNHHHHHQYDQHRHQPDAPPLLPPSSPPPLSPALTTAAPCSCWRPPSCWGRGATSTSRCSTSSTSRYAATRDSARRRTPEEWGVYGGWRLRPGGEAHERRGHHHQGGSQRQLLRPLRPYGSGALSAREPSGAWRSSIRCALSFEGERSSMSPEAVAPSACYPP